MSDTGVASLCQIGRVVAHPAVGLDFCPPDRARVKRCLCSTEVQRPCLDPSSEPLGSVEGGAGCVRPLSETAENITRVITEAIKEWKLPDVLGLTLVSDNASNMVKARKLLQCHLHLGCFAHTLNLAVQKALKVDGTAAILSIIRRISTFFHRSHLASSLLQAKAELLQLKAKKLKVDVCTRWNSAFDMLSRFLYLQDAVVAVIRSKELSYLKERDITSLNDEEAAAAHELEPFLKPLKDMTTFMCAEEMPTSSVIMPLLESLVGEKGHLHPKPDDSLSVQQTHTQLHINHTHNITPTTRTTPHQPHAQHHTNHTQHHTNHRYNTAPTSRTTPHQPHVQHHTYYTHKATPTV